MHAPYARTDTVARPRLKWQHLQVGKAAIRESS